MTFHQFLKIKKGIDPDSRPMDELMDEYYDEYTDYLKGVKEGCGPKE